MAEKQQEYLCKCTNCLTFFIDDNPGDQAKSDIIKENGIREMTILIDDNGEMYRGCQFCNTDEFLIDIEL